MTIILYATRSSILILLTCWFSSFQSILAKDELAGLACLEDVDSRIVRGGTLAEGGDDRWEVEHGPFEEKVSKKNHIQAEGFYVQRRYCPSGQKRNSPILWVLVTSALNIV